MKKGITLKDMAQKLNMSVSTVSKSLNNDHAISAFTKERVKELARRWNYVANESARNFKLNKSFTIGLIIPDLRDSFFVEAINGIEEVAGPKAGSSFLFTSYPAIPGKNGHFKNNFKRCNRPFARHLRAFGAFE